jgi:nickel-dependent lactate racemase
MSGYKKPCVSDDEIKKALREPVGTKPLSKIAQGKKEVVIVVDDLTRATRAYQILPHLLAELKRAGISDDHIRFVMGGGLHAAWYRYDFAKKLGEENVERYPVYNHTPFSNCEKLGETTKGTPVEINAEYSSCDLRIGIGSVVPHPDSGFSGGAKILLPGISSFDSIRHMHVDVPAPGTTTTWGVLSGNRLREDIDEAGDISGIEMKIDVLLNGFADSSEIFAGKCRDEFSRAVAKARQHYLTPDFPEVDVLVANAYAKASQASLGIINWKHRVKKNGIFVLIAQAPEGQGTHYLYGKFGKRSFAPGCVPSEKEELTKLIVFSDYKIADPLLPIAANPIIWLKDWKDVISEIKSVSTDPTVAILPNSDIQCDKQRLGQEPNTVRPP